MPTTLFSIARLARVEKSIPGTASLFPIVLTNVV